MEYKMLPVGDSALTIVFGNKIDPETSRIVRIARKYLSGKNIEGVTEYVQTYSTLMVHYRPVEIGYDELAGIIDTELSNMDTSGDRMKKHTILIPVCYGGEFGPDLQTVCDHAHLTADEAGEAQEQASEDIIREATEQALQILKDMHKDRESFRKVGLTFEEKAFYDILIALRDQYNFEYGEDNVIDGVAVNEKCRSLAKKIKEIIDTKSSFADWLNNQIVRDQLKFDIKVCLIKNGYPPQYSPEVFSKVMEQVENFEENSN